jgi:DNA-binding transcriptional LysR family regulator
VKAKIDLNRVATFVRVIETGSFTAAARELGVPISSVSRGVAHLEQDVGVRLLHRTTRRIALTDAGQQYFQRMHTVIAEAHAATFAVAGSARAASGLVRITAPDSGLLELPSLLSRIAAQHPGLELDLTVTPRRLDLIEEGIDLAIRGGALEDSSLVARRIGESDFGVVAAPSYLEQRGTPRKLADLQHHACIRFRSRNGIMPWRLDGPGGSKSVQATGPLISDDFGFVHQAVLQGAGLAFLPIHALRKDFDARRLVRVLPRHRLLGSSLYIVWPSQRLLPARVVLVRDLLIAELSKALAP